MRPAVWSAAAASAQLKMGRQLYEEMLAAVSAGKREEAMAAAAAQAGAGGARLEGERDPSSNIASLGERSQKANTVEQSGSTKARMLIAVDLARTVSGVDSAFAEAGASQHPRRDQQQTSIGRILSSSHSLT